MVNNLYPIPDGFDIEHYPNTAKYIMLYGILDLMSKWDLKAPYKTVEEVYGECLKQEVTWKELLNFKGYDPNILL